MDIIVLEKEVQLMKDCNAKVSEAHTLLAASGLGFISFATVKSIRPELTGALDMMRTAFPFNVADLKPSERLTLRESAQEQGKVVEDEDLFYALAIVASYHDAIQQKLISL